MRFVMPATGRFVAVLLALPLCALLAIAAGAAELVTSTPEWLAGPGRDPATAPPAGKEADWILGDHVLRNDHIAAVIADPVPSRHANMTVRNDGGCIIDLTLADAANDQLSCWYPGDGTVAYRFAGAVAEGRSPADTTAARPLALAAVFCADCGQTSRYTSFTLPGTACCGFGRLPPQESPAGKRSSFDSFVRKSQVTRCPV
jgi:hypothetical protein